MALVAITETRGRMCDDKVEWKRGNWLLPSLLQRALSLPINFRFFLINKAYQFRNLIHGSWLIITDPQPRVGIFLFKMRLLIHDLSC